MLLELLSAVDSGISLSWSLKGSPMYSQTQKISPYRLMDAFLFRFASSPMFTGSSVYQCGFLSLSPFLDLGPLTQPLAETIRVGNGQEFLKLHSQDINNSSQLHSPLHLLFQAALECTVLWDTLGNAHVCIRVALLN